MSVFVLDASITLCWLFDDETHIKADNVLMALEKSGAIVPYLWHAEIRNALLVATRRNRITKQDAIERLDALKDLPIQTDDAPDYDTAFELADKYKLSLYDALYLELAVRKQCPLASLDNQLIGAATSNAGEGLPIL